MNAPGDKAAARAARVSTNLAAIAQHLEECVDLAGRGRDAFLGDDFVNRYAALGALIQAGNAVKDLPDDFRTAHPEVHWRSLTGMRDKVGHIYGEGIDWVALWETVEHDVAPELAGVRAIIASAGPGTGT